MKKYIKKHLKDEKRILKLMYKKGFFKILNIDFEDLSWELLLEGKSQRKRKGEWAYKDFLPELHVWSRDYWGECDSNSLVDCLKQYLFWETAKDYDLETGFPINQKYPTTKFLIGYLTKLPTINNDSKFNKYLIRNDE